jgi:hypothetical protein
MGRTSRLVPLSKSGTCSVQKSRKRNSLIIAIQAQTCQKEHCGAGQEHPSRATGTLIRTGLLVANRSQKCTRGNAVGADSVRSSLRGANGRPDLREEWSSTVLPIDFQHHSPSSVGPIHLYSLSFIGPGSGRIRIERSACRRRHPSLLTKAGL